jgi:formyl-CoA transferase
LNAPYQAFRTADGYITVAAITNQQWERFCTVMGREPLATDVRYATNEVRMEHLPELVIEIEEALSEGKTDDWVERLLAAGVPAGPIHDYAQVFGDAHTHARKMVEEIEHPVEGRIRTLGIPLVMSGTPPRVRRPPPLLGEHTAEVLSELGLAQ